MSALPENWEWDYDGESQRWFYRYKPTGITQFHFPQPGDEFPQSVDDSAPIDLEPEERLVSQLQVKRRSTVGEKTSTAKTKNTLASATIAEDDDGSNAPWFQPDIFMYMGPGAYDDISPLQEDDDDLTAKKSPKTGQTDPPASTSASAPAPTPSPVPPRTSEASPQQSNISPVVSAETTPLVVQSLPVIEHQPVTESTPANQNQPFIESHSVIESQPVIAQHVIESRPIVQDLPARATQEVARVQIAEVHGESAPLVDAIPLLDSRQVAYTPVGFMAELASELTGQCHEDINPTPVELPGNDIMMDTGPPLLYANAFPLAPAELHSEAIPPSRMHRGTEQKALSSGSPGLNTHRQQTGAYSSNNQPPPDPYRPPLRQNSMPQPAPASTQLDSTRDPYQGQYRPWNPTMNAVAEEVSKQAPVRENKRHSLAGPPPSNWRRPEVPAALSAPMVSPKQPVNSAEESTATAQPRNASGLTHVPSVLQPARGRPVLTKSPPQTQSPPSQSPPNHNTDNNQRYTAYKPTSWDLQRDIEETVEMLSKTGYGQAAADPGVPDRPALPRTSTAPGESMTGSYYGMRPQIPPSAPSAPSALQNVKSQPTLSYHYNISEASTARSTGFSAPLPPSSPDLPQPLKLTRKSPPPPPDQNRLPTVSSTLRPPAPPTEVYIVSRETTPAPPDNQMASAPTMSTPEIQAARLQDPVSPPQTPPLSSKYAMANSPKPPSLSFSARTSIWGREQQAAGLQNSLTVAAEPLTKIHSDPLPVQNSSPDITNVYILNNKPAMPTSQGPVQDDSTPPQRIPPRESSLHQDQGQYPSTASKRQSVPPSAVSTAWQSQYFQPATGGYMKPQLTPGQTPIHPRTQHESPVERGPPRPAKTPHTPESHNSSLLTPPPSLPPYTSSANQPGQQLQHPKTPTPQNTFDRASHAAIGTAPLALPTQSAGPPTRSEVPYVLPAGHHPLSSHPVDLSQIPTSRSPAPTRPSQQVPQADPPQTSSSRNNRYSMFISPGTTFASTQPSQATPSSLGSERSPPVANKRWSMVGPPPPQPPSTNTDERVPPGLVPQRTASLRRATPKPNRSSPGPPPPPPPPPPQQQQQQQRQ
ncbi:hypothetical protein QBC41DRAFT_317777, partial [Cercophora samala]